MDNDLNKIESNPEALAYIGEQYKAQYELVVRQVDRLITELNSIKSIKETVKSIDTLKDYDKAILMPIDNKIMINIKIVDNKILYNLGSGYFIEMNKEDLLKKLEEDEKDVKSSIEKLSKSKKELEEALSYIDLKLRQLVNK
ncbi:MAG: prefoldin subunit alpha [Candidatus Micrarchaeota archaeon]|nr:MAG: prefoldin subunit alpha [Candidatus Micrarchaeota archaeon]